MSEKELDGDNKKASPKVRICNFVLRFCKCLAIAVVIVAVFVGLLLYFNIYLPMGEGPAGPEVPMEPFTKVWSDQPVLLLGIGDSITDGFGASDGFSYFNRLIKASYYCRMCRKA